MNGKNSSKPPTAYLRLCESFSKEALRLGVLARILWKNNNFIPEYRIRLSINKLTT